MKSLFASVLPLFGTLAFYCCDAATISELAPQNSPKSDFVDSIEFGKDPFYPKSSRRPKVTVKNIETEPARSTVPDFIVLKGISVLKDRRLAIINNYTLSEGEEFSLKNSGQPIKVKCLEIKERSAVISVNGATKEIPLRPGF